MSARAGIAVAGDIYVYRPLTSSDYSGGHFRKLMAGPGPNTTTEIALVEKATSVGGTWLAAGDLLFTQSGNQQQNQVYWHRTASGTPPRCATGWRHVSALTP